MIFNQLINQRKSCNKFSNFFIFQISFKSLCNIETVCDHSRFKRYWFVDSRIIFCKHMPITLIKVCACFISILMCLLNKFALIKRRIKSKFCWTWGENSSWYSSSIVLIKIFVSCQSLKRKNIEVQTVISRSHYLLPVVIFVIVVIPHLSSINEFKAEVFDLV